MQQSYQPEKYQLFCQRRNKANMICIEPSCQASSACCLNENCQQCRKSHFKCKILRFDVLYNKILKKKQQITPQILEGVKVMEKAYDEAIDRLSKDKLYISSQFQFFGYNQHQIQFMHLLKDGMSDQINGKLNSKIILSLDIKKQWLASKQNIERYWKNKQSKFTDIFNKFLKRTLYGSVTIDSKITKDVDKIVQFFEEDYQIKSFKLLYRASQNDFQVSRFHSKCDGKPNTLVLIRTQFEKIIGGFTTNHWSKSNRYQSSIPGCTFIFSVTNNQRYNSTLPQQATYSQQNYGPTFGGGHDIYISNHSNMPNSGSYTNFPCSFNNGKYQNSQASYNAFSGANNSYNVSFVEWQVFEVQFLSKK